MNEPMRPSALRRSFTGLTLGGILDNCLSPGELRSIAAELNLPFKGTAPGKADPNLIVRVLVDRIQSKDKAAADVLIRYFEPMFREDVQKYSAMQVFEIRASGREITATGRGTSGLLWALAVDPRPEARALLREIQKEIRQQLESAPSAGSPAAGNRTATAPEQPEQPESLPSILEPFQRRIEEAARAMVRKAGTIAREHEQCPRRIESLQKRIEALKEELADRDGKLGERNQKISSLQSAIGGLSGKLDEAQAQLANRADARRLEKEVKKLAHELEALRGQKERADRAESEFGRLAREVEGLKEQVQEERRQKEDALRQAQTARAEVPQGGSPGPAKPDGHFKRDQGRIAILADTQSLFFPAQRRSGRINYPALFERAAAGRRIYKAIAYVVDVPGVETTRFKRVLEKAGFKIKAAMAGPSADKSPWSDELAADLRDAAMRCGCVTIVSQDPALVGPIQEASASGCEILVVAFEEDIPAELTRACSEVIAIDAALMLPIATGRYVRP